MTQVDPLKFLFLFSDTGGGHRSAAEAIIEALALQTEVPTIQTELVDFLRDYYPWPYRKFPEIYRELAKRPALWGGVFHSTNGKQRNRILTDVNRFNPLLVKRHWEMVAQHPADLVVLTHFFAIRPLRWLQQHRHIRTCVVVTDLVTTHASWFDAGIDHYIVPTNAVRENAIRHGVAPEKIQVIGLPVSPRFSTAQSIDKSILRAELGWSATKPVALLMGGGDGMGAVYENVQAIANAGLDIELAVVTGRNTELRTTLTHMDWEIPVHVYGFVRNVPELMQAADVLLTKAGPSTLCEGIASGLPIIVYSYLPGQEVGNIDYLTERGAGGFASNPQEVVVALRAHFANGASTQQLKREIVSEQQMASAKIAAALRQFASQPVCLEKDQHIT